MVNIVTLFNFHNHSLIFIDKALSFFKWWELISSSKVDGFLLLSIDQHHTFRMWEKTRLGVFNFIFIHLWQLSFSNSDEIRLVIRYFLWVQAFDRLRIIRSYMRVTKLLSRREVKLFVRDVLSFGVVDKNTCLIVIRSNSTIVDLFLIWKNWINDSIILSLKTLC